MRGTVVAAFVVKQAVIVCGYLLVNQGGTDHE
jgi:hypothetical protein